MRKWLKLILAIDCIVLIFIPSLLSAAEIRIVDERGLLRAVRSVKSKGEVKIKGILKNNDSTWPSSIMLSSADGVASDIEARSSGEGNYTASGIGGGTWKIMSSSKGLVVTKVTLGEVP